ncbi:hypothetical protein [Methylobacter sp. sgz302048]|uniref:hypothetical protein n=1 Tax=Methylobacter sp. sgz302048 TaxID=3455945 RepID=UPI003FA16C9D
MVRHSVDCHQDRLLDRDVDPLDQAIAKSEHRPKRTERQRVGMDQMECEARELRQASEILRKASAYFAPAEFDRRFKP